MDRTKYTLEVKHHVLVRAMQRGIHPDLIENTIFNGKIERFGKDYVKFMSRSIICIGEISGLTLKIITIERRKKK